MRCAWPILVGIAVLGCKDPPAQQRAPAPGSPPGAPGKPGKPSAPATPRLDPTEAAGGFDSETEDKDWATNTERAIQAAAPELTDVDCKQQSCRATLTAGTEAELVQKADRLSEEDSLRGTEAHSVLLTKPETVNGKLSMKIYVRYER